MSTSKTVRPRAGQPRPSYQRVNSKKTRHTAFEPFRSLIQKLYIDDGRPLNWIMEHMRQEFGITHSVKQYKSQLKVWGLRHKLTQRDAAFILRLLNQARDQGLPEVVVFSGAVRRRDDIEKYIQRNEKLANEDELLTCISDRDETPSYIKLQLPAQGEHLSASHLPPTPPSASSFGTFDRQSTISPLRPSFGSPECTPRSSGEWANVQSETGTWPMTQPALGAGSSTNTHPSGQIAVQHVLDPFWSQQGLVGPANVEYQYTQTAELLSAEYTHAVLSVTPAVAVDLEDINFDTNHFDSLTQSEQLNDSSRTAYFVTSCLFWLICAGQEESRSNPNTESCLTSALITFLSMLDDSNGEECFGALSIVSVLFECYGQREGLSLLLTRCEEYARSRHGQNSPLTFTIEFKKNLLKGGVKCPRHDTARLAQTVESLKAHSFRNPGPLLTARFNLAWAKLENALKSGSQMSESLHDTRVELEALLLDCEAHLGESRIETIMAAATLGRAKHLCGDTVGAVEMIGNVILPRVLRNFPEQHPYVWEVKHRFALLLFSAALKEEGLPQRSHLRLAEQLLRVVVSFRRRVLGESNPKSIDSFRLLRDLLIYDSRRGEAETLAEWCDTEGRHRDVRW
jgi:hypothetical protein